MLYMCQCLRDAPGRKAHMSFHARCYLYNESYETTLSWTGFACKLKKNLVFVLFITICTFSKVSCLIDRVFFRSTFFFLAIYWIITRDLITLYHHYHYYYHYHYRLIKFKIRIKNT